MEGVRAESVLALMLSVACARDAAVEEKARAAEILARHHDPDIDPRGDWVIETGFVSQVIHIVPLAASRQFSVQLQTEYDCGGASTSAGTGTLADGVLTLSMPAPESDDRLHFCRFGERELLLPEKGVWFRRGEDPVPLGQVFRRDLSGSDDETPAAGDSAFGAYGKEK